MGEYSGRAKALLDDELLTKIFEDYQRDQLEAAMFCLPDRDNDSKRLSLLSNASVIEHLRTELKLLVDAKD